MSNFKVGSWVESNDEIRIINGLRVEKIKVRGFVVSKDGRTSVVKTQERGDVIVFNTLLSRISDYKLPLEEQVDTALALGDKEWFMEATNKIKQKKLVEELLREVTG